MIVAERSLLFVDVTVQPLSGTHFVVIKIPWSSINQWPRPIATSVPMMYHFFSQVAILGTRENDKSIYARVRIAINVACVRIERLTLAMPMAMLPVH